MGTMTKSMWKRYSMRQTRSKVKLPKVTTRRGAKRTFLTFSDHDTYRSAFPMSKRRLTQQKTCPITRLPAKYYDPVTQHPYANLQAFRILRETYYNQLEQKGDKSDPEVAAWLAWRQKNKPSKPSILNPISRPPQAFANLLLNTNTTGNAGQQQQQQQLPVPQQQQQQTQ